jgi:hypothetical protein
VTVVIYFLFVGVSALLALHNWRLGLLLMLFAGALQDPVRKMMAGSPSWMVLAFTPVLFAVLANVFLGKGRAWRHFMLSMPKLRKKISLFTGALLLAFLVLIFKHGPGAILVGLIGLIGYLFPVLAIGLGFFYVRSAEDVRHFILVYCALTAVLLIGGLLEHWNLFPGWPAIGTAALNMDWIRHVPGYIVRLTSGFYRSPDMLGWHAALLVMFALQMTLYARGKIARGLWVALAAWGVTILLISGRNKMIFMPPIFLATLGLAYLHKGNVSRALTAALAGVVSLGLFLGINQQVQLDREYFDYAAVGTQTASGRLQSHGLESVVTTVRQSGFFGEGLGTASTGARFGGTHVKTWQESGPSKVMVELGVIGFVAAALLCIAILRHLWTALQGMPRDAPNGILFVGFLGILVANAASFTVSHQAFGDPFLVTLTGFFIGIALSAPRWAFGPAPRAA